MPSAAPRKKNVPPPSNDPDKQYVGSVRLELLLSDTGYVCSTRLMEGMNDELNKKAEQSVHEWHLKPGSRNGHAVPVAIAVQVDFWKNGKGEIFTQNPGAPPQPDGQPKSQ